MRQNVWEFGQRSEHGEFVERNEADRPNASSEFGRLPMLNNSHAWTNQNCCNKTALVRIESGVFPVRRIFFSFFFCLPEEKHVDQPLAKEDGTQVILASNMFKCHLIKSNVSFFFFSFLNLRYIPLYNRLFYFCQPVWINVKSNQKPK